MKYKHGGIWVTKNDGHLPKYLWLHKDGFSVDIKNTKHSWYRVSSGYDPTTYNTCRLAPLILGVWNEN